MQSLPADASMPTAPILNTILSVGCTLFAIGVPAIVAYIAFNHPQMIVDNLHLKAPRAVESFSTFKRLCFGGLATIPSLCQAYSLFCARGCFQSFARGEFFTLKVIRHLRGFAAGLFFSITAAFLVKPLLTFVATQHSGPGEHEFFIHLDVSDGPVLTLLFAGMLWQIAGVMTSAKRLAEENAQFI
jgi:hypothetical protein